MDDGCSDGHVTQDSNDTADDILRLPQQSFHILEDKNNDQQLQTVTLCNSHSSAMGPTILQYAPGSNGQYYIPVQQIGSSAGVVSFPHGGGILVPGLRESLGHDDGDEAVRRRELRLLKNKEAAKECRRKKKDYVRCLENRVAVLENQNKTLIEELKSLKELYCQKDVHT